MTTSFTCCLDSYALLGRSFVSRKDFAQWESKLVGRREVAILSRIPLGFALPLLEVFPVTLLYLLGNKINRIPTRG